MENFNIEPPFKRPCIRNMDPSWEYQYLGILKYIIEDGGSYNNETQCITTFSPPMMSFYLYGGYIPILTTREINIRECIRLTLRSLDTIKSTIASEFSNTIDTVATWGQNVVVNTKSTTQFFLEELDVSCHVYIYYVDIINGLPYDLVHHALTLHIIAHLLGRRAKRISFSIGSCYFDTTYIADVLEQINRVPLKCPKVHIISDNRDTVEFGDIHIENYQFLPDIRVSEQQNHHETRNNGEQTSSYVV